jgi:ubiquinone/menaquinone biosynthesis C-methylase UbiE
MKNKTNKNSKAKGEFWNKEYKDATHLKLSEEPSSDLITFVKWVNRNAEWPAFFQGGFVLDIGCGNGRNIGNLCEQYHMKGLGFDISEEAIRQAKEKFGHMKGITFMKESMFNNVNLPAQSVDIVLDMMVIHFLDDDKRQAYIKDKANLMKPFSWMLLKTFVLENDQNAIRMIKDYPTPTKEHNSYIHPKFKALEHVFTEDELEELFSPYFIIHKMIKSYKHFKDGKPYKRRTVCVYLERKRD